MRVADFLWRHWLGLTTDRVGPLVTWDVGRVFIIGLVIIGLVFAWRGRRRDGISSMSFSYIIAAAVGTVVGSVVRLDSYLGWVSLSSAIFGVMVALFQKSRGSDRELLRAGPASVNIVYATTAFSGFVFACLGAAAVAVVVTVGEYRESPISGRGLVELLTVVLVVFVALFLSFRWAARCSASLQAGALVAFAALSGLAVKGLWVQYADQRVIVLEEMRRRSDDPWPRGAGHMMVSGFGAPIEGRGWMEAGGGFSPSLGSFGLSFWIIGKDGRRLATSDDLDISSLKHSQSHVGTGAVITSGEFYEVTYKVTAANGFDISINNRTDLSQGLELVVRSVGPAGAPLRQIDIDGSLMRINNRWSLNLPVGASVVALGDERKTSISAGSRSTLSVTSPHGWAFARIRLPKAVVALRIVDNSKTASPAFPLPGQNGCVVNGFPPQFEARIAAHTTNLLYSLVGSETRPADPVDYPLAWEADGAYVVVALSRCGHAATTRRLAEFFAQYDHFGGFGPEGDQLGIALWALGEVSTALDDRSFDESIWPHVQRKAGEIERMMETRTQMRRPFMGPITPYWILHRDLDLMADPAFRNGLIVGRKDWHRPIFYINAISYLGLREAAALAVRLGHMKISQEWNERAETIKVAYRDLMGSLPTDDRQMMDEENIINALYPADIAEPRKVEELLDRHWREERMLNGGFRKIPAWTYFSFAQAHQWLRLGNVDRVHKTLSWFDEHDRMPGLQIFWEGYSYGPESFPLWRNYRGNVRPKGRTPHFWTAAEALLLHIEMLAFFDGQSGNIVIGGGIPTSWFDRPLSVERIGTAVGPVSWSWDGSGRVVLQIPKGLRAVLGPGFPASTTIEFR